MGACDGSAATSQTLAMDAPLSSASSATATLRPGTRKDGVTEPRLSLDHTDFDAVYRRQRLEQAHPPLAAVLCDPELTGCGAVRERPRLHGVDLHRVAQHSV